jgi:hypothetical protein
MFHLPCYKMLALISQFGGPPLERIGVNHFLPILELSTEDEGEPLKRVNITLSPSPYFFRGYDGNLSHSRPFHSRSYDIGCQHDCQPVFQKGASIVKPAGKAFEWRKLSEACNLFYITWTAQPALNSNFL